MVDVEKDADCSFKTEPYDEHLLGTDPVRSNDDPKDKPRQSRHWILYVGASIVTILVLALAAEVGVVISSKARAASSNKHAVASAQSPWPTSSPSTSPTVSPPTLHPSTIPTSVPSHYPSSFPSKIPSDSPSSSPSAYPTDADQVTTFYAIGDVPYTAQQAVKLQAQMLALPDDAEFLIHVGDLRAENSDQVCVQSDYQSVAAILRLSHAPVFVVLGDNDWNDCPNRDAGLAFWKEEFLSFQSRYWNHTFDVLNQPGRPENFAFEHKGTLFIGLNLVGGLVQSTLEWSTRLTDEVNWTMALIRTYAEHIAPSVGRVVIFGQANPTDNHLAFFDPLKYFIQDELHNDLPILYLHGDGHYWLYERNYLNQSSFLRIMVSGLAVDPPLKVMVHANREMAWTQYAFVYDRMLV